MFNESCWRCRFLAQIPDVDASVDVPDVSGDVSVAAPDMSLPDVSGEASLPSVGGDPSVPQVSSTVNASHVKRYAPRVPFLVRWGFYFCFF